MSKKIAFCIPADIEADLVDNGHNMVQRLYRLVPPAQIDGEEIEYVIVSAILNKLAHETMIFASDEQGIWTGQSLYVLGRIMSHQVTLYKFGYEIQDYSSE